MISPMPINWLPFCVPRKSSFSSRSLLPESKRLAVNSIPIREAEKNKQANQLPLSLGWNHSLSLAERKVATVKDGADKVQATDSVARGLVEIEDEDENRSATNRGRCVFVNS
ncbi:hypothetical protein OWV82_020108 [Melia azedarach]|uniref:Uncharacterized protein n=1 Tax=Melia azedarach TaxID=155640 RepID=A0ACC1X5K4_MELAZ|nr:hypothetical protein OWV82_020108 [Melia azedarach]